LDYNQVAERNSILRPEEKRPGPNNTRPNPPDNPPTFSAVTEPISPPSSGESYAYLTDSQMPSLADLNRIGKGISSGTGLQCYILYNNKWSQDPTTYWSQETTNTIYYINKAQYIYLCEKSPDGGVDATYLGYMESGIHPGLFEANTKGWHQLMIWGSESGWSNNLLIYVD
jgi:hypothetical protein